MLVFPTTVWTRIHQAAAWDRAALDEFAAQYRPAVLSFIERRGYDRTAAEDLCQDVFVRLLRGEVLAKADPARGRFRTLVLTVTTRVLQDEARKRRPRPGLEIDLPQPDPARDFDHAWALHLTERALERLRDEKSPHYDVLVSHVAGDKQNRQRLWTARRRLADAVRREIALTCASPADLEAELSHLARYLRPAGDAAKPDAKKIPDAAPGAPPASPASPAAPASRASPVPPASPVSPVPPHAPPSETTS